jgi:hypothetical protein
MLGAIKISRFFFSRQTSTTTFIGFFIKLMLDGLNGTLAN